MRLNIILRPQRNNIILTWHYQYPMQAAIYKVLRKAEPEYADFLHNTGYALDETRRTKMFTFSKLEIPRTDTNRSGMILDSSQSISFLLSSPMEDTFVQNVVIGLFQDSHFSLGDKFTPAADFVVEAVESLPEPEFGEKVSGQMLSPLLCSIQREDGSAEYLKALDERLPEQIRRNIFKKHEALHGSVPEGAEIQFAIDREYMVQNSTKYIWNR